MMANISNSFVNFLDKYIEIQPEDKELYEYGIRQGFQMLINVFTTVLIGLIYGMVWQSILILIFFIPIRSYAGGYHSKTAFRCYLLSTVIIILALFVIRLDFWTRGDCLLIALIACIVICFLSPVETLSKRLDRNEIKVYRMRTRLILGVEIIIMIIFSLLGNLEVVLCITISLLMLSLLLVLGKVSLHFVDNIDREKFEKS